MITLETSFVIAILSVLALLLSCPETTSSVPDQCNTNATLVREGNDNFSVDQCSKTLVFNHSESKNRSALHILVRLCEGKVDFNVTWPAGKSCNETKTEMFPAQSAEAGDGTSLGQRTYELVNASDGCSGNYTVIARNADSHSPPKPAQIGLLFTTNASHVHGLPSLPPENRVMAYCGKDSVSVKLNWTAPTNASLSQCVYYRRIDQANAGGRACTVHVAGQPFNLTASTLEKCGVNPPFTVTNLGVRSAYRFDVILVDNTTKQSLTNAYQAVRITTCPKSGSTPPPVSTSGASFAHVYGIVHALACITLLFVF